MNIIGQTGKKCGLVLEGGAMRGLFTAGVLDVLMERGVRFDGLIGVSAGACFGCNYKSGQIGRVIRYNKRFAKDPRYCSLRSLLATGDVFGADFCYRRSPPARRCLSHQRSRSTYPASATIPIGCSAFMTSDAGPARWHLRTTCSEDLPGSEAGRFSNLLREKCAMRKTAIFGIITGIEKGKS